MATTTPALSRSPDQQEQEQQQASPSSSSASCWVVGDAAQQLSIPIPRDVLIYEQDAVIEVNRGEVPFVVGGWEWVAQTKGKDLASALLSPDPLAYADRWLKEARVGFQQRQAEPEWDALLTNGGLCGGRRLRWALMELPPHRTFQLHVHPVLEVVHIIRGRLHERRMLGPPLDLSADDGKAVAEMAPVDLSNQEREFADGVFPEDCINVNEVRERVEWDKGKGGGGWVGWVCPTGLCRPDLTILTILPTKRTNQPNEMNGHPHTRRGRCTSRSRRGRAACCCASGRAT